MKIKEGMVYHIRDDYFDLVQGCGIKSKTVAGRTYPAYCCYVDNTSSIIWMIPMSTRIEKYRAVYDKEMKRYGHCLSVVFGMYDGKCAAFLTQGMFPVVKKHILHPHTRKGKAISVERAIRENVRSNFDKLRELEQKGISCVLSDIRRAEQILSSTAATQAYSPPCSCLPQTDSCGNARGARFGVHASRSRTVVSGG